MPKLKIIIQKPKMLKGRKALLVSFPYSMEAVARIKSLPSRIYDAENRAWEVPLSKLQDVIELFPDYTVDMQGKVTEKEKEKVNSVIKFDGKAVEGFEFKTTPFEHQIESFEYAKTNPKFLLGDEQGLGKTKQIIDIALSRRSQFKHCLIVCGVNSLKHNWKEEIKIHSNEVGRVLGTKLVKGRLKDGSTKDKLSDLEKNLEEFFLITNVEALRSKEVADKIEELCKNGTIGMTVIDEVHKCKNPTSIQGKAIHKLKSYYRIAASGTPLMNAPQDLFNVLKWLGVEKSSFYKFKGRYCIMGGFGNHQIVAHKNLDELQRNLSSVMIRRKKSEVLDLPPKLRSIEYVEMSSKQQALYNEVKLSIKENLANIKLSPNPLSQLIRLRQVTGHPEIISDKVTESAKMDRLYEMVQDLKESGQKAIIFTEFKEVAERARKLLSEFNPAYVVGGSDDVEDSKARFMNDPECNVILGTRSVLGTGHTLTAASYVIFIDKPWNLANTEQAEDRAHRIGTKGTVNIVTLVCKDTIDEKIEQIIESKGDIADALVDGNKGKMSKVEMLNHLLS